MATVPARLAADGDPWAAMDDEPQSIEPLVDRYRADLADGIPDAPWPPVYPKMPDEAPPGEPEPGPARLSAFTRRGTQCDRPAISVMIPSCR